MSLSNKLYEDFEIEITKSEYKRTRLMIGTFVIGLVIILSNFFFIDKDVSDFYGGISNYFFIIFWILLLIGY